MIFVLLACSFTMAMAVHVARGGKHRPLIGFLTATIILGFAFLRMKFTDISINGRNTWFSG